MVNEATENTGQLDLSQLAVDRTTTKRPVVVKRRAWLSRYVLPAAILLSFGGLFVWAARESFLPATPVTITPVVVSRAEVKQEGTPLFQAPGWIEPRPSPVVASSLAPGVISEVLVVAGQSVESGEVLARLIEADAKLALREAEAEHSLQQAELRRAEATLSAARTNLAQPVELRAALADAEAVAADTEITLVNLPFALETAQTKLELAEDNVRRKVAAGDAVPGRVLREARAELANATSALKELEARRPTLEAQLVSLRRRREALAKKLELLTEEIRAVAVAEADVAASKARTEQTQLAIESAQLTLERMVVRSPITGRVLSLEARPGQRLSGINPHSEQGSSAVVSLYDPTSLQVRVDVRLEDVPQVQIGQAVTIETAAAGQPIAGEVISVTTRADIQKNTLEVKAAITAPPEVIKPEMLAKVTFLAPASNVAVDDTGQRPLRVFVPESLLTVDESGTSVWVADLTAQVAHRRSIEVGLVAASAGLVEVVRGISPTDKLIVAGRQQLTDGARIDVSGEDTTLRGNSLSLLGSGSTTPRTAEQRADQTN